MAFSRAAKPRVALVVSLPTSRQSNFNVKTALCRGTKKSASVSQQELV
ncbi:hypothetical protein [Desulfovibrio sp.]|nr:hypothetical protein [Desulfovibrio sp.]